MTATASHTEQLADFRAELRHLDPDIQVDDSRLARALYSSDASIYRVVPAAVVHPHDEAQVRALCQAASAVGLPITSRGAGTSCAGNAVGPGVIVDLSGMDEIADVDVEHKRVRVQPGVVQEQLQRVLRPFGLRYGPDPSTSSRCTIGGMIGNNACGPRALAYGRTADTIESARLVIAGGEVEPLAAAASSDWASERVSALVERNLGTIRTQFGSFSRQLSGYSMEHLLPENRRDMAKFIAGTEGTLGIVTEACVSLVAERPCSITVALGYASMAEAADAITALLPFCPVACEGFGRRIVEVVARSGKPVPDLPRGDGWIFVELRADSNAQARRDANALVSASNALDGRVVTDEREAAALWRIRADGAGLAGVSLEKPAWAGWEDAAVPPERLGAYLRDFDRLLAEYDLHGLPYGHFGEGCVHCRIDYPLDEPDGPARYKQFVTAAAELVASHGGSMSGEHGDGRARSALLPTMYSPEALDLFAGIKHIFDPHNIMNPGVLVDPHPVEENIRVHQARTSPLTLSHPDFAAAVHQCTGVGKCIADNSGAGGVMCPSHQASGLEKDSTRGRAKVLQEMVNGTLVHGWNSPEVAEALDLCMACKGCSRDCPTGTDMAKYRSRVLYEKYRHRLRPRSHWTMGQLPRWERMMDAIPGLARTANAVLSVPPITRLARWVAGVDQRRPLPRFRRSVRREMPPAHRTSSAQAVRSGRDVSQAPHGRVVIWVDSFSDRLEGCDLAAMVAVLANAGYAPEVLTDEACCGLTWITTGQLDTARRRLRAALDVLGPLAEAGIPVVGVEPSCTAVWHSDALDLVGDDPRTEAVARNVHTLAEMLQAARWTPPSLAGHVVVAQPHCHHASVLGFGPDAELLRAAGAELRVVGGCCGYAGNFGVEKGHYEFSVAVAKHDLLPAIEEAGPEAIILADGFSCRRQTSELAGRRALTLAELLASHLPQ